MPKILHESAGLTIKKNDKNRFIVATLHFTADPHKRSKDWYEEARAGMRPADWEKEYEINYVALFGERVFPQFVAYKSKIVIGPPYPEFPNNLPMWGGFDYGPRNPSSFHVYTAWEDTIYSIWELFEPCTNLPAFAQKLKDCPYWNRLRYVAADPSIWAPTQQKDNVLVSIHDLFWENGVRKMIRGNNQEEQAFIALLNTYWYDLEHVEPRFKLFADCHNQVRELETAVYADQSAKLMQSHNLKENISNFNNHSIDDLKYFFLSRPNVTSHKSIVIPNMAKWWKV